MPTHHEVCILPYRREDLFQIITRVEDYPEFLPWLQSAHVYERQQDSFLADLTIGYGPLNESYTSKVTFEENEWVKAVCIKGPFRVLETSWIFKDVDATSVEGGTEVELDIVYEFSSFILQKLLSGVFEEASQKIMQGFKSRAKATLG